MRKILYFLSFLTLLLLTGCEGEKELKIIESQLPIKTSGLYLVGDATPSGWSIDAPTPMKASAEDPLIFTWEGTLYTGDMKLCLVPGSWESPFIRPIIDGAEISKTDIVDQKFDMHAGDPDKKWKVTVAGKYRLTYNLRQWTMSTAYLGEPEKPAVEPIETETLYILGSATPGGWSMESAMSLTKDATNKYIFTWEGTLTVGEMKACTERDNTFSCPFLRPSSASVEITSAGITANDFIYSMAPDYKWNVKTAGKYRLTFDLEHWTLKVDYLGAVTPGVIETETLFIVGSATPGGWNMESAVSLTKDATNKYLFAWEGMLIVGEMKACTVRDNTFTCPFLRPSSSTVDISSAGITANDFVYTTSPDDKWNVKETGKYRLTFDLENKTLQVAWLGSGGGGTTPIETETLYIVGSATPGGWSMDDATALTKDATNKYLFTWEGTLSIGEMKACTVRDGSFSCPFLRPSSATVDISSAGITATDFVYTTSPDDKWNVKEAGTYSLTFDLKNYTIQVVKK